MKKLLELGLILATLAVPIYLSREKNAARGFRKLGWTMFIVTVVWGILLKFLYYKLS